MKRFIISLLAFISFAGLYAQSPIFEVNGIYYRLLEETEGNNTNGLVAAVTTMGNTDYYKGTVSIPATVSHNGVDYPVTTISDLAFKGSKQLTSISIPASVTKIPAGAFYGCNSLTTITVAASNTVYDSRNNCNAVIETATNTLIAGCKSSIMPSSVLHIGDCAFYGSTIASLEIPPHILSIGNWAFLDCFDLTSVKISDGVANIGTGAFMGCVNITSLDFPSSVAAIGTSAFSDCSITELHWNNQIVPRDLGYTFPNVTSVVLGDSVSFIYYKAFSGCRQLKSIVIPSSIQSIDPSAFYECNTLETLFWDAKDSLGTLFESVLKSSTNTLKKLELGKNAIIAGFNDYYLNGFISLESITVHPDNPLFDSRNNCNAVIDSRTGRLVIGCCKTVIPDGITEIGDCAFLNCHSLKSIQIPSSVKVIGYDAFAGCDSLMNTQLPSSLERIGVSAFSGCSSFTSINIPKNVSYIGTYAILNCPGLESITVDAGNTVFDSRNNSNAIIETQTNKLIAGCKKTVIPGNITTIGTYAFMNCYGLTDIQIPSSVKVIENKAFYGCKGLTAINLPNSLTSIGESAFAYSENITSLSIPSGITRIENCLVMGCSSLVSIDIPASVTSIGDCAFFECSSLESVIIPEGVTDVSYLFDGCNSLTYLSLPSTATFERRRYPFSGCPALKTAGPRGGGYDLEFCWDTIPGCAFNGMTGLKSIHIPKTVKMINTQGVDYMYFNYLDYHGNNAYVFRAYYFAGCYNLESLEISFSDTKILSRRSAESRYEYEIPANYLLYMGTPIHSITILDDTIKTLAPIAVGMIDEVIVSRNVKHINPGVFGLLRNIVKIEAEDGNSKYSSANGILFNNDKSELLAYPTARKGGFRVPSTVTSIAAMSFKECKGLIDIKIPDKVMSIGESAFEGCDSLQEVLIDGSPEIALNAFKNDNNINGVWTRSAVPGILNISDSLQAIVTGDYTCFAGSSSFGSSSFDINATYNDDLGRTVTEVTAFGITNWICNIALPKIPQGRYKVTIGILPSPEMLPNYIHPVIKANTESGTVTILDSIITSNVEIIPDVFIDVQKPYYITNDVSGYDTMCVGVIEARDEYMSLVLSLSSGVNERNESRYSSTMIIDRIFLEPLELDAPVESYAATFTKDVFDNATLYVPDGSVNAYKAADGWKLFKNIATNTRSYPAEEVEVTIGESGYATFYYSDGDYALPTGLSAMVVSAVSDGRLLYETIALGSDNGIIPAGVPVIIASDEKKAGVYKLTLDNHQDFDGTNLLIGSDVDTQTYAESSSRFYKLAYGPSGTDLSDVLGWYWGAADGGAFSIEGHKAWLALPKSTTKGIAGFTLAGDATFIPEIDTDDTPNQKVIYDLYGRKLSAPTGSGIYIIDGKKVIVTE